MPPEEGGTIITGRFANGKIESNENRLSGKKISWNADHSFTLGNTRYEQINKADMKWLKEGLCKFSSKYGADSFNIYFAGP